MTTLEENAVSRFCNGYTCTQAVLSVYAEELGLDEDAAIRIAGGFGGGIGRTGHTCGAVTGAIMVIGLMHGSAVAQDREAKDEVYSLVQEMLRRFEDRCGSTLCRELLECDISVPEEYARAREQDLFQTRCPAFVKTVIQIVEELKPG
jgi:C_GCAxxG_C_C family probable redox protein